MGASANQSRRRRPVSDDATIQWLLAGDPAIRWQTLRDLCGASDRVVARERAKVAREGWGSRLLAHQRASGHWGRGSYQPKWTCTTYTLQSLRELGLPARHRQALRGCRALLDDGFYRDGGINFATKHEQSETCITGLVLASAAHFGCRDGRVGRLVEYLLAEQMPDGGWNCQRHRGATHSSMHTTIMALEALHECEVGRDRRARRAVIAAQARGREFLLRHRLFRSHRTGQVIDPRWLRFSFPTRWHYDALRALEYFAACDAPRDNRLREAIALVEERRQPAGRWLVQNRWAGNVFFWMEPTGQPSRWNTLRALRVLRWWYRVQR